jgi:CubicO group peptidase (beta-lactamase class C family)
MHGMDVHGSADGRFGPVRDGFTEVVRAQPGTGAGFAAWCEGRLVVDLWGGYADAERRRPWAADSLVQPYSVSKPFAAVCALRLAESGRLDLDAPVQRYWPEFSAVDHAGVLRAGWVGDGPPVQRRAPPGGRRRSRPSTGTEPRRRWRASTRL